MKKMISLLLIFTLLLGLGACGSANENNETLSAQGAETEVGVSQQEPSVLEESIQEIPEEDMMSLDVIYYLDLGNGSIMAACANEEGVAMMGKDYFVVLLDQAELVNAVGEAVALKDVSRGSTLQIQWPGMVMESYPAQIAAARVTVTDAQIDPDFPAEDQIPAVDGGDKWWEPQPVTELPGLNVEYTTSDYAVCMFLRGLGNWSYEQDGESVMITSDGSHPLEMTYDDNNTIKRGDFDTIRLISVPEADTLVISAYVDGSGEAVDVAMEADGTVVLLEGSEVIYVVSGFWNGTNYSGDATYAFKVLTAGA